MDTKTMTDEELMNVVGGSEIRTSYKCAMCELKFRTKREFDEHMKKQHDQSSSVRGLR